MIAHSFLVYLFLAAFSVTAPVANGFSLPKTIRKCVERDDFCVANSLTYIVQHNDEYPELGVPNLDPFSPQGEYKLHSSGPMGSRPFQFDINMWNVKISGFKNLFVQDFSGLTPDLTNTKISAKLTIPLIETTSNFTSNLTIAEKTSKPLGILITDFTDVEIPLTIDGEYVNRDGKDYYIIKSVKAHMNVTLMKVNIQGYRIYKVQWVHEKLNKMFNDNWKMFKSKLDESLDEHLGNIIRAIFTPILEKVAVQDFFTTTAEIQESSTPKAIPSVPPTPTIPTTTTTSTVPITPTIPATPNNVVLPLESDDSSVAQQLTYFVQHSDEYPELGVPNLDPLSPQGEFELHSNKPIGNQSFQFDVTMWNVKIFGFKNLLVQDFSGLTPDLINTKISAKLSVPHVEVTSNFTSNLTIAEKTSKPLGILITDFTDVEIPLTIEGEYVNRDGKDYYVIKSVKAHMNVTLMKVNIQGYRIYKVQWVHEKLNKMFNDNWKLFKSKLDESLDEHLGNIIRAIFTPILEKVAVQDFFQN